MSNHLCSFFIVCNRDWSPRFDTQYFCSLKLIQMNKPACLVFKFILYMQTLGRAIQILTFNFRSDIRVCNLQVNRPTRSIRKYRGLYWLVLVITFDRNLYCLKFMMNNGFLCFWQLWRLTRVPDRNWRNSLFQDVGII